MPIVNMQNRKKMENTAEQSETDRSADEDDEYPRQIRRKNSFVWKYFRSIGGRNCECIICKACIGNQTSNLARHLLGSHNIVRQGSEQNTRGRPSRSFIWKYCTKEDSTHARCHLCNNLLFCGGGNTSNIKKHLRRKHQEDLSEKIFEDDTKSKGIMDESKETTQAIAAIDDDAGESEAPVSESPLLIKHEASYSNSSKERKDRKGGSYVWNYCDKLSRHTIRCKLCNKTMSFHGTANIITHLQRRHNIVGRIDNERKPSLDINDTEENYNAEHLDDSSFDTSRRRSAASSIVWKYCKRIGADVVRCTFCKKNLSYQGTSNLQRHLHRMHGVVTQGRAFRYEETETGDDGQYEQFDRSFVWEHCAKTEDGRIKCKMCAAYFNADDMQQVHKHLSVTHAIKPQKNPAKRIKRRVSADQSSEEYDDYEETNNWSNRDDDAEYVVEFSESNIKKDDSLFGDIIEEDDQGREQDNDEDPFEPSHFQEFPVANPLSPQSSRGASPEPRAQNAYNGNNKKLRKLNEDRMRMETEYFREKAGYYRMLKYLTALQAKKVRSELEQLKGSNMNGVAYSMSEQHDVPPAQQEEFIK